MRPLLQTARLVAATNSTRALTGDAAAHHHTVRASFHAHDPHHGAFQSPQNGHWAWHTDILVLLIVLHVLAFFYGLYLLYQRHTGKSRALLPKTPLERTVSSQASGALIGAVLLGKIPAQPSPRMVAGSFLDKPKHMLGWPVKVAA